MSGDVICLSCHDKNVLADAQKAWEALEPWVGVGTQSDEKAEIQVRGAVQAMKKALRI